MKIKCGINVVKIAIFDFTSLFKPGDANRILGRFVESLDSTSKIAILNNYLSYDSSCNLTCYILIRVGVPLCKIEESQESRQHIISTKLL